MDRSETASVGGLVHYKIRCRPILTPRLRSNSIESDRSLESLFAHDLIRKPVPTFRDHALVAGFETRGARIQLAPRPNEVVEHEPHCSAYHRPRKAEQPTGDKTINSGIDK